MTAKRDPWCLQCGHQSVYVTNSMDPRYVIITCMYLTGDGKTRGCGRTLGTWDESEAAAAADLHRQDRRHAAHARGLHSRKPVEGCEPCEGRPLTADVEPHELDATLTHQQLRKHLVYHHHSTAARALIARQHEAAAAQLHQQLHGEGH